MEIIVQETNVSVYFEEQNRLLVVEWKGKSSFGEYKSVHEHALFFAKKVHAQHLLLDQRQLSNPDFRTRTWTIFNFFPAVMLGIGAQAKIAILPSLSGRDTLSSALLTFKKAPLVRFFENRDEAQHWLNESSEG